MNAYHIEDNFLSDFNGFRLYCDDLDYTGMKNDVDGVFYPCVTDDIPEDIKVEVKEKLEGLLGGEVNINSLFVRQSPLGVDCPHQVHTDSSMGSLAFMLYMNRMEDCLGGTSFVIHKEVGMYSDPINEKQLSVWRRDHNNRDDWQIMDMISMIPNRGLLFKAPMMHRAEPIGGFGHNNKDSRLVLTAFLDMA